MNGPSSRFCIHLLHYRLPAREKCSLKQAHLPAFESEQFFLSGQPATKPCQISIASNDPVAGNDDGNRIRPVRQPHRARRFWIADAPSQFSVTYRLSIEDFAQVLPHKKLKFRALKNHRQIELLQLSVKVRLQLPD